MNAEQKQEEEKVELSEVQLFMDWHYPVSTGMAMHSLEARIFLELDFTLRLLR